MSIKAIKIVGAILSVASAGLTIATDAIKEKKLNAKIEEKAAEAVAKILKEKGL